MNPERVRRRRVLQIGGTALAVGAAGCLGDDGGSSDDGTDGDDGGDGGSEDGDDWDTPSYAEWVPAVDGRAVVLYSDISALQELQGQDQQSQNDSNGSIGDIEDPMLALPLSSVFTLALVGAFGLAEPGLSGLLDEESSDQTFESSVSELLVANDTTILTGDIDPAEIDEQVTTAPEDDFYATEFEQTDEVGDYTIYEPASSGSGDGDNGSQMGGQGSGQTVLAVAADAILMADGRDPVETVIETKAGDGTRATEKFDAFAQLLATAGDGQMVYGGYSPDGIDELQQESAGQDGQQAGNTSGDQQFEELSGATGIVSSLTFDDSGGATADTALEYEGAEDQRDAIESLLGSAGEDVSVEFDGAFVTASATYSEEDLQQS